MNPKQLIFHDDARDKIRRGVDTLAQAVKVTVGPRGRTVVLERDFGSQEIAHVAATSANNDRSIGDLLASAIDKVGREGAISIEDGSGLVSVLDETSGIHLVARSLEEPLRCIVSNAGDEPSVILNRVDESPDPAFGYNAASRTYGDLLQMGVIDPGGATPMF
ncbi:MAG TPA: hypothetical protein VIK56_12405 [Rhodoferax sp.]